MVRTSTVARGTDRGSEDTRSLAGGLTMLDRYYDFEIRAVQLAYDSRNLVGDGCKERTDAELSTFGVDVLERSNALDVVVDLSHCGEQTTNDAIEHSASPPAFTPVDHFGTIPEGNNSSVGSADTSVSWPS